MKAKFTVHKTSKIVAQRGAYTFMVDTGDGKAVVVDTITKKVHKPFNLQSILARGYWEDVTADDAILKEAMSLYENSTVNNL